MKNTMKTVERVCWFVFVLAAPALAQNRAISGPSPAVAGPAYDVSFGYSNLMMAIPGAKHVNLNGLDLSGSVSLSPRWGATLDSSYAHTFDVLGTGHQGYVLSILSGPVFYPVERRNTRMFVRALAGAGLVDGAVPTSDKQYVYGWLLRPSYAVGGGVEHSVSGAFAVRISGDYLRTSFYDSLRGVQSQNNLRFTMSFVFRLKEHQHRSSLQLR